VLSGIGSDPAVLNQNDCECSAGAAGKARHLEYQTHYRDPRRAQRDPRQPHAGQRASCQLDDIELWLAVTAAHANQVFVADEGRLRERN
jgi:hypothetical protein